MVAILVTIFEKISTLLDFALCTNVHILNFYQNSGRGGDSGDNLMHGGDDLNIGCGGNFCEN